MENQKKSQSRRVRNDLLLIALLLLVAAAGAVWLFVFRENGNTVSVTVDGAVYGVYPLSEPFETEIRSGENGEQFNRLVIRDGKAFVEAADCPDGICAAHRPIFRDGESIVCLPHGVVVTVTAQADADTDAPDVVI